jgi:hypothetical protein
MTANAREDRLADVRRLAMPWSGTLRIDAALITPSEAIAPESRRRLGALLDRRLGSATAR